MAAAGKTRQAMPSPQGSHSATSTHSSGIAAMRESVRRFGRSVGTGMGPVLLDHHRVNRGQLVTSLLINRNIFSNADGDYAESWQGRSPKLWEPQKSRRGARGRGGSALSSWWI